MARSRLATAETAAQRSKGRKASAAGRGSGLRVRRVDAAPEEGARRGRSPPAPLPVPVQGVLFDVGDTLLDEAGGMRGQDPILPGVRRTLAEISPQFRMAVLSNTRSSTRVEVAELLSSLGIARHFRAIVTSSDIGWRKPHPLAFEAALAVLGVPPAAAVMVGNDLVSDIAGAKAMGMRTIHFRWSPRYRQDPASDLERATVVISEFEELPVALERANGVPVPARTAVVEESTMFGEGLPDDESAHGETGQDGKGT